MWLEAKTGDVQSSCLATATVTALAAAAATAAAAGTVVVAAAAAAATTTTTNATCTTMAEPTNLRHSASFSCLSRNNTAMASAAAVVPLSSDYRARTATLSAVDLDYGFVVRPRAMVAATGAASSVIATKRSESTMVAQVSPSCELSINYGCCANDSGGSSGVGSASGNLLSLSETGMSSIPNAACISQADDDWIRSEHERPNLSKKVLIKKSVSLLNPNGWWASKFRRGGKSNKNKDKNLQEIQTQKRWKSLGALLRVSSTNSSRTSTAAQSSLPAPQSFYLLDDFLEPSTNCHREDKENGRNDVYSNSTPVPARLSFSAKIRSAARFVPTRYLEHKNLACTEFCSVCKQYGDSSNCDRDASVTSFDSAVLQRYCCRNYFAADKPKQGVCVSSADAGRNGCCKSASPKSRTEKRHSEFPLLQSGDTSCLARSQNLNSKDHVCGSGQQVTESSGVESLIVRPQPPQLRTARASLSVVRGSSLYSSSLLNKTEGSQTKDENFLTNGSDANVKVVFSIAEAPQVAKRKPSLSKPCVTVNNSHCEKTNNIAGGTGGSCRSDNSGNNNNTMDTKTLPLTPAEALEHFGTFLTDYEKKEVLNFSDVWFLGLNACKLRNDENSGINFGFDDENGNYNKVLNDHLCYRYEVLDVLGKGSFGQVVKAFDHKTKTYVAIKIIRNKKRFYHQAQVELVILNHLRKKDTNRSHNVVHMLDYFYFRRHLCITFELLHMNLYEVIKRNGYHGFNLSIVKKYAFSLVQCLKLLYREKIIHCDLKPENILLQKEHSHKIKVIDFGSSCYTYQKVYTYIQSRFYRSPEIILGLPYDRAIDMWSFGCILAELHTGYPLFPGENEVEQLACIMEIIGLPPYDVLARATRRKLFFDTKGSPRCTVNSKQRRRKPGSKDLSEALRTDDALFIDFVARCLEWNPEKRLAADEALQHSWFKNFASDETIASDLRIEDACNFLPPL